jgi:hypothetical protein
MAIETGTLLLLLTTHFVADFLLQSDWMALNKSKSWKALIAHCAVYAACFVYFGLAFAVITFLLHALTDTVTSRITSKLWQAGERHWFFVVIGFDQLIHYFTLIGTYLWLLG